MREHWESRGFLKGENYIEGEYRRVWREGKRQFFKERRADCRGEMVGVRKVGLGE